MAKAAKAPEASAEPAAETTAVVKADERKLAAYGGLMDTTPVDVKDFLIPKLLLMQDMTKVVKAEKARAGEIRGSVDLNKLAERGGAFEIIPFSVYKTWTTLTKKGSEFVSQEPITAVNYKRPRDEIKDGVEVENFETLNYYCLLPQEIEKGMFLPYVVSFRSTSYMAGKTLETHRAKLQEFGLPLPFKTFLLGSAAKKNDFGEFYIFTIAESRDSTEKELDAVKHWHAIVKQGAAKVDESDLKDRGETPAGSASAAGKVNQGDEY